MDEYIDREALYDFKKELMSEFIDLCRGNDYNKLTLLKIGDTVDKIFEKYCTKPAADVAEVRHGEWIEHDCVSSYEGCLSGFSCSECGRFVIDEVFDCDYFDKVFCGRCGAKMDGKENDHE